MSPPVADFLYWWITSPMVTRVGSWYISPMGQPPLRSVSVRGSLVTRGMSTFRAGECVTHGVFLLAHGARPRLPVWARGIYSLAGRSRRSRGSRGSLSTPWPAGAAGAAGACQPLGRPEPREPVNPLAGRSRGTCWTGSTNGGWSKSMSGQTGRKCPEFLTLL